MQLIDTRSTGPVQPMPAGQTMANTDSRIDPRQFDTTVASSMSNGLPLGIQDERVPANRPGFLPTQDELVPANRPGFLPTQDVLVPANRPGFLPTQDVLVPANRPDALVTMQDTTTTQRTQLDPNATTPPPALPLPLVFTPEQLADMANRGAQGGDGTTPVGPDGAPVPVSGVAGRAGA